VKTALSSIFGIATQVLRHLFSKPFDDDLAGSFSQRTVKATDARGSAATTASFAPYLRQVFINFMMFSFSELNKIE